MRSRASTAWSMTSRRSLPRRSSGSSCSRAGLLIAAAGSLLATLSVHAAGDGGPLKQTLAGAAVDWEAGTVTASAGAAADLRMPSVDLARPGAQRRAHAGAVAKLRAALASLPLGSGNNKLSNPE